LWFWHASFLGSWGCLLFPLQASSFAFGITSSKAPSFVSLLISHKMQCWPVALKTDHSFMRRDAETHTSYQGHNFHITGVNELKLWLVQVETCTDMALLRSRVITPFKLRNKIIPWTK
jgi:hypothetical protein